MKIFGNETKPKYGVLILLWLEAKNSKQKEAKNSKRKEAKKNVFLFVLRNQRTLV
jgi:hypothetical protein